MQWGDLITLEYGKPIKDKESANGPIPVYGTNGQIGTSHLKPLCEHPSFILGRKGAYRGVHYSDTPFSVIDTAFYAKPISDKVDLKWAYYKFLTYDINRMDSGSAIPSTDRYEIYSIDVDLPDLVTQRRVVSVLELLDNKIQDNNKINDNLEQQTQAIFKSWFVNFEPFNGIMPYNWAACTLGDITEMGAGGDKPKESSPVKTLSHPSPLYSNGINNHGLYGYTNEPKIKDESVTVSARGTIGYVCLRHHPYVPIVRLVTLIPDVNVVSAKYLYLYLCQLHIAGTGTTQQQLTVPDFRKTEIVVPDKTIMSAFTEAVTPIFEQIWVNEDENIKLAEIRDSLLPKLMSGELDVSSVEL